MSELTQCNYCSLQAMKRKAAERGVAVILGKDEWGWITARYSDQDEPSTCFLNLSEQCAC